MIGKLAKILRTVRHMKFEQVSGQIRSRLIRLRPDFELVCNGVRFETPPTDWISTILRAENPVENVFEFLNVSQKVDKPSDWDRAEQLFLWRYNLHYFDFINSANGLRQGRGLHWIHRWIDEHQTGIGWDPYPTSLRIVNWIKHDWLGQPLSQQARNSLLVQASYLTRSLEHHILANHLLANAKALVFAAVYFINDPSEALMRIGLPILEEQLEEQFNDDGGHYERSPMYHILLSEDLLDIINLYRVASEKGVQSRLAGLHQKAKQLAVRAVNFAHSMQHPDGAIPLFNDAAFGIAPTVVELIEYANRLDIDTPHQAEPAVVWHRDSQFARIKVGRQTLFASLGGPSPVYQPGHSHADTFSFELSLDNRRLFVDSGTDRYFNSVERDWQRSTAAHNCLSVNGADISETWSSFRVGRRARIYDTQVNENADGCIRLSGNHDGFECIRGCQRHQREWIVHPAKTTIVDAVSGNGLVKIQTYFHLHPDVSVKTEGCLASFSVNGISAGQLRAEHPWKTYPTDYYPEFGKIHRKTTLETCFDCELPYRQVFDFEVTGSV
jgi:uncharacterized heparinase superfamily protein